MELRHLRYFIAVAETGSLTVAAEQRLNTSQPSLSRQIRDLEEQIGTNLFIRNSQGVIMTDAGKAFIDHARRALLQVDAAVDAARRAVPSSKQRFALGFLTGEEMTWLPECMHILRAELPNVDVSVTSDYSIDLAAQIAHGTLDLAFCRVEPTFDLAYRVIDKEPLVVLLPSDHRLTAQDVIAPQELVDESFLAMGNKAKVLRSVIDGYLERSGVVLKAAQSVNNPAMVMSLIASTRGVTLIPGFVKALMPWSVDSRPLAGEVPTIDLSIAYNKTNTSPILTFFLDKVTEMIVRKSQSIV
ncbi:LysR family transcriptional regulator [Caballeronia sp. M23-90]